MRNIFLKYYYFEKIYTFLYMSSVKVVDLNEEAKEEEEEEQPTAIEETHQEEAEVANEIVEEPKEEEKPKTTPKEKAKAKAKAKVQCNTCDKSMTYKNFRYYHDDHCSEDKIEYKPIKKQANPKGKAKPKPKPKAIPQPIYEDENDYDETEDDEEEVIHQPQPTKFKLVKPKPQPVNPVSALSQHYQILQAQYIKEKQEKYNNLCQNMFKTKPKKR